jgi:hypothetical protein
MPAGCCSRHGGCHRRTRSVRTTHRDRLREALRDSLADLLHRAVALASTVGLDLGDVAAGASRLSTASAPPARPVPF